MKLKKGAYAPGFLEKTYKLYFLVNLPKFLDLVRDYRKWGHEGNLKKNGKSYQQMRVIKLAKLHVSHQKVFVKLCPSNSSHFFCQKNCKYWIKNVSTLPLLDFSLFYRQEHFPTKGMLIPKTENFETEVSTSSNGTWISWGNLSNKCPIYYCMITN